jgi:Tfp pilus assembly protein PilZ
MIQQCRGIFLRPKVYVQGVDLVQVLLLVRKVEARQVPGRVVWQSGGVDDQRDEVGLKMRVADMGMIEVSMESILIWGSGRICDL